MYMKPAAMITPMPMWHRGIDRTAPHLVQCAPPPPVRLFVLSVCHFVCYVCYQVPSLVLECVRPLPLNGKKNNASLRIPASCLLLCIHRSLHYFRSSAPSDLPLPSTPARVLPTRIQYGTYHRPDTAVAAPIPIPASHVWCYPPPPPSQCPRTSVSRNHVLEILSFLNLVLVCSWSTFRGGFLFPGLGGSSTLGEIRAPSWRLRG